MKNTKIFCLILKILNIAFVVFGFFATLYGVIKFDGINKLIPAIEFIALTSATQYLLFGYKHKSRIYKIIYTCLLTFTLLIELVFWAINKTTPFEAYSYIPLLAGFACLSVLSGNSHLKKEICFVLTLGALLISLYVAIICQFQVLNTDFSTNPFVFGNWVRVALVAILLNTFIIRRLMKIPESEETDEV